MLNDRQRVEYSLIPALLESYIHPLNKISGEFESVMQTLGLEYRKYLKDDPKLYRRMDRIANKIIKYTVSQKFDSRKAVLCVIAWLVALCDAGALILEKGKYWDLLEELGETIQIGYDTIPDFEKIDASAINHVQSIHDIAVKEGYFT